MVSGRGSPDQDAVALTALVTRSFHHESAAQAQVPAWSASKLRVLMLDVPERACAVDPLVSIARRVSTTPRDEGEMRARGDLVFRSPRVPYLHADGGLFRFFVANLPSPPKRPPPASPARGESLGDALSLCELQGSREWPLWTPRRPRYGPHLLLHDRPCGHTSASA